MTVIITKPIKSRNPLEPVKAFDELYYDYLIESGITLILHKFNSETSNNLIVAIKREKLKYQTVTARHY